MGGKYLNVGIFLFILSVVVISGCTSSIGSPLPFSDGSINFNYPNSYKNSTDPGSIISGSSSWVDMAHFQDSNGAMINIQKNEKTSNPAGVQQASALSLKNTVSTGQVLSLTHETNPNGVTVYKSITTMKDPDTNEVLKYIDFYFKDNKNVVYGISVYDSESQFQKVTNTANMIFDSLKLS